jgi:hypothetical protein
MLALELAGYWLSPGVWSKGTIQFSNGPQALLNGAIASGATSLVINQFPTGAQVFPAGLAAGDFFYFLLDLEIFKCTAYGGVGSLTWTVVGAQDSTTASAHASGAVITGILNAAALAFLRDNAAGYSGIAKNSGATVSQRGVLNIIEGTGVTVTLADNGGTGRTDLTINSSGGGGGGSAVSIGTYASIPGSPNNGDVYKVTDSQYELIRSAGVWEHFIEGIHVKRPDISTFTNVGSAPDNTDNSRGPFVMSKLYGAGYNWTMYTKALPTGGTGYTITLGFRARFTSEPPDQAYVSIILRESSSGKFWANGWGRENADQGGDAVIFFTNPTTYGGSNPLAGSSNRWSSGRTLFVRVQDDGTNWTYFSGWGNSVDPSNISNVNWAQVLQITHNGSMTPDQCGFGMTLKDGVGTHAVFMEAVHFSATSP